MDAGVGPMNYVGDLLDKKFTTKEMKYNGSIGISYHFKPHFRGNFYLMAGKIGASDAKNAVKWHYRNLSFETALFEGALTFEYDLKDITQPENSFADQNPDKFTPYIFAGLGVFHYNPYTYDLSGKKVFLQPLGTEAQTTPYSLLQVAIPYGIGVRYALNNTMLVSAEFNYRKLFTDYLDDVSQHQFPDTVALLASHGQEAASLSYRADEIPNNPYQFYGYRGNPDKKDGFYSIIIKFSYQLFTHKPKFYYGY